MDSLSEQWSKLESCFSLIEKCMEQELKQLQSKERQLMDAAEKLEKWENEVELKEKSLVERLKQVEILEAKAKQYQQQQAFDTLMVKEKEKEKENEKREEEVVLLRQGGKQQSPTMQLLKVEEEEDHQSKKSQACSEVFIKAPHPKSCDDIQQLCRNMDAIGLCSYLTEQSENLRELLLKFSNTLQLARDPAKLVFDVILKLYEIMDSSSVSKQIYILSCCILPKGLLKLKVNITPHLKDAAREFSNLWKGCLDSQGGSALDIYAFLQFLASYKLAQSYDTDELLKYLGAFYTETEVLWPERGSYLCQILGLMSFIPGQIQYLIKKGEQLRAVVFICAFKMEKHFPPASVLNSHWDCIRKRAEMMVEEGGRSAQKKAIKMELSGLKALLECISNFKLESIFSPSLVELRIRHLEKERKRKRDSESSLIGKTKSVLGKEANDHAHLKSCRKRT